MKFLNYLLDHSFVAEMAISRSDVDRRIKSQSVNLFTHYVKLVTMPNNQATNHWKGEICGWVNAWRDMRYSHNNKTLTTQDYLYHIFTNNFDFDAQRYRMIMADLVEDQYTITNAIVPDDAAFVELLTKLFTIISTGRRVTADQL